MLSLVHLIYMAGDKCMRQNACCQMVWGEQGGLQVGHYKSHC